MEISPNENELPKKLRETFETIAAICVPRSHKNRDKNDHNDNISTVALFWPAFYEFCTSELNKEQFQIQRLFQLIAGRDAKYITKTGFIQSVTRDKDVIALLSKKDSRLSLFLNPVRFKEAFASMDEDCRLD